MQLHGFQQEAVDVAIGCHRGRVLLADDMGLGKTLQALAIACHFLHEWPLLILAPASVLHVWHQHLTRLLPSLSQHHQQHHQMIHLTTHMRPHPNARVWLCSYHMATRFFQSSSSSPSPQVIIADESHLLKSPFTHRSRILLPILATANRLILITATPALSRPIELYTQLSLLDPGLRTTLLPYLKHRYATTPNTTPNYKHHKEITYVDFGKRYCQPQYRNGRWLFNGAQRLDELKHVVLDKLMIRRMKADVLGHMGMHVIKYRSVHFLELSPTSPTTSTTTSTTAEAEADDLVCADNGNEPESSSLDDPDNRLLPDNELQKFRHVARLKAPLICHYLSQTLLDSPSAPTHDSTPPPHQQQQQPQSLLFFAHHQCVLDAVETWCRRHRIGYVRIDGQTSHKDRQERVEQFQAGEAPCDFSLPSSTPPSALHKTVIPELDEVDDGEVKQSTRSVFHDGQDDDFADMPIYNKPTLACSKPKSSTSSSSRHGASHKSNSTSLATLPTVPIRIAICSLGAASVGLTLTRANQVIFGELFWNPGTLVQAEDRAYRIGQTRHVAVTYLVLKDHPQHHHHRHQHRRQSREGGVGEFDERVWNMLVRKLEVLSGVGFGTGGGLDLTAPIGRMGSDDPISTLTAVKGVTKRVGGGDENANHVVVNRTKLGDGHDRDDRDDFRGDGEAEFWGELDDGALEEVMQRYETETCG